MKEWAWSPLPCLGPARHLCLSSPSCKMVTVEVGGEEEAMQWGRRSSQCVQAPGVCCHLPVMIVSEADSQGDVRLEGLTFHSPNSRKLGAGVDLTPSLPSAVRGLWGKSPASEPEAPCTTGVLIAAARSGTVPGAVAWTSSPAGTGGPCG